MEANLCLEAAERPQWPRVYSLEKDHRAILLERNSQRRQEAGKYYEIFCANVLFKTSLMLAGTNMPGMPKDEQEAGKGAARAASSSS